MSELDRIRAAYRKRDRTIALGEYSLWNTAVLSAVHQRERTILRLLRRYQLTDLGGVTILDIGCGDGRLLQRFVDYGASPKGLHGIDLLENRIERARSLNPGISFHCGSAEQLPYEAQLFDIVMQFTVFTSILDQGMKRRMAEEMLRVLKPNGIILWYDYHISNPRNPDVRGVGRKEICRLFPGCGIDLKRVTLLPPLARRLGPHSELLMYLLEKIAFLRTHYLGVIRKKGAEARL